MVSKVDMEKDIKDMCELTGSQIFGLDEIRKNLEPGMNYNEKLLEDKAEKFFGDFWRDNLVNSGILAPKADGKFDFTPSSATRGGGGTCYSGGFISVADSQDARVIYHEFGHSFQHSLNLFDDEKIDKVYDFCKKGIKSKSESDLEKKLVGRYLYDKHLTEAHSEVFSFACMDLRSKNLISRAWNKYSSWTGDKIMFVTGLLDNRTGENDYLKKSYSSSPSRRELNKRLKNYRKTGEIKKFYNEKGGINFELLAKECEDIVLKSTYSPREYKNFVTKKFYKKNDKKEPGYKRTNWQLDTVKSIAAIPIAIPYILTTIPSVGRMIKSELKVLLSNAKAVIKNKPAVKDMLPEKDSECKAINGFLKINAARAKLHSAVYKKSKFASGFIGLLNIESFIAEGMPIPDCIPKKMMKNWSGEFGKFGKKRIEKVLNDYIKEVNTQIKNNKENKAFGVLMTNYGNSYTNANQVSKMYDIKMKSNDSVIPDDMQIQPSQARSREEKFLIRHVNNITNPLKFDEVCKDKETALKLRSELLTKLIEDPAALTDKTFLKEMTQKYADNSKNKDGVNPIIEIQATMLQAFTVEERNNINYKTMKDNICADGSKTYAENFSKMVDADRKAQAEEKKAAKKLSPNLNSPDKDNKEQAQSNKDQTQQNKILNDQVISKFNSAVLNAQNSVINTDAGKTSDISKNKIMLAEKKLSTETLNIRLNRETR